MLPNLLFSYGRQISKLSSKKNEKYISGAAVIYIYMYKMSLRKRGPNHADLRKLYESTCQCLSHLKGSGSTDIGDLELLTLGYKADFSESNYVLHLSRFTLVAEIFGLPQRASSQTLFYRFTPEGFHY